MQAGSEPFGTSSTADALDPLTSLFGAGPATILTGAGISTDSGIPDYRGAGSPPRTPMRIDQFLDDERYRQRFWAGARVGALHRQGIEPNAGHRAVAALEAAGLLNGVITQNVDGLHRRAGSRTVVELHGSGATVRCLPAGHRWQRAEVLAWFDVANPGFVERSADAEITSDGDADVADTAGTVVPVCPACGGMLRPDVVYFGEHVDPQVFAAAGDLIEHAHGLVVAGSSSP
ncbi:Sir2 family NAD-dependent protein deacetylase [Leucobacter soli]|uniref:Sir2 family NAD-dependent protein deacetylase n=1 Tax=Leucobacter soli TaxID=2812850 RepID=UPI0036234817